MELKNNQGVLFKNEKTKDNQPDFRGEIKVDRETYKIALWKKKSKNDNVYLSVQVEPKKEREEPETVGEYLDEHKVNFNAYDNLNDTIPF